MTDELDKEAFQAELAGHYRWFHSHPEPSYQEFDTTAHIRQILAAEGITILEDTKLATGLVALVEGRHGQRAADADSPDRAQPASRAAEQTVAIRGDIDALPITEETGLPYASQRPGLMHGCGHDFNLTSALGAALYLHRHRADFSGRVKVLFQPAEEIGEDEDTPTGAVTVLGSGALDDVSAIFGIHDTPALPVGTFGLSAGAVTGAVSKFRIWLQGQGSHAAFPQQGRSPIRAAAGLVGAIETITGQDIDPLAPCVVTVTHLQAGSTWNVIPDKAIIEGTVRTLGSQTRTVVHQRMAALATGTATAYDVATTLDWQDGSPSVENDPRLAAFAAGIAAELGLPTAPAASGLVGEDFSYYQERVPGLFLYSGVGAKAGSMHGPHFAPDISGLADTARFLAHLAMRAADDRPVAGGKAA